MKRKELNSIITALVEVSDLKGVKFAYTIIKNKKKIEEEIKNLEEAIKPKPEFEEFEKERIELCEKHSDKDITGKAIIADNQYKIIDLAQFEIELAEIRVKYAEVLKYRDEQITEYNALLDEEVGIEFDQITLTDLPADITAAQIDVIEFMIKW